MNITFKYHKWNSKTWHPARYAKKFGPNWFFLNINSELPLEPENRTSQTICCRCQVPRSCTGLMKNYTLTLNSWKICTPYFFFIWSKSNFFLNLKWLLNLRDIQQLYILSIIIIIFIHVGRKVPEFWSESLMKGCRKQNFKIIFLIIIQTSKKNIRNYIF